LLKLAHYLKPHLAAVILAMVLLFTQAISELFLPNLMGDIVNIGIQQGGIEEGTPRAISEEGFNFIKAFMSEEDQALFSEHYVLKSADDLDSKGQPYVNSWPEAAGQNLYVLEDVSPETMLKLEDAFGTTTWTMLNLMQRVQAAVEDGSLTPLLEGQMRNQAIDQIAIELEKAQTPLPPGMTYGTLAEQVYDQQLKSGGFGDKSQLPGGLGALGTPGSASATGSAGSAGAAGSETNAGSATSTGDVSAPGDASASGDSSSTDDASASGDSSSTDDAGASGDSSAEAAPQIDSQSIDITQMYELLPLIKLLPPEWLTEAQTTAQSLEPSMRNQSATMLVSAFYRELGADMTGIEMSYILRIGLIMLAVTTITGLATILVGYISAKVGAGVARAIRSAMFSKVASFSHAEFDRFSTASLITRSTNDVMMMQMIISMGIRMVCYAPIMGIGGAIMAINKSVSMSWIVVLAAVVMLGGVTLQMSIVTPRFRLVQRLTDRLNLVAREKLTGLMVIRAFNRDDVERQRFDEANLDLTNTHIFIGRIMTLMGPFLTIIMNGMSILIIWVGGHQVAAAQMQVGDMMAYMQYIMQVMMSFMMFSMMFMMLPRAQVSATRIAEVLETQPSIVDPAEPLKIAPGMRGMVEFNDVSFRYEGAEEDALQDINFAAQPGQMIAFIGPTGSGKSSIMNLIPRFYDVSTGSISVNGVDVRDLTQSELRSHIGYVPQLSTLMSGNIATNISYGVQDRDLSYDDLIDISTVAQAIDFIGEKDEGFYFPVAQSGANVSGGQKQRLAIARALAIQPDIYLFDDSFSALDFSTDVALRRALKEYTTDATLLVISQRIGTIMEADVIHVVDEGRIINSGSHDELLVNCPEYYEIASSQLAEVAETARPASLTEGGGQ
jgi:ATP-binding cassette subfamily B protein